MTENNENIKNEELQPETEAPVTEKETDCNQETTEQAADNTDNADSDTDTKAEPAEEIDPLEAAQARIKELETQALYKQAEFENFRKRTIKEKSELILNGGEKTVKAILPVLDDFERAMQQAEKAEDVAAVKEGMELIFKKFLKTLEGMGVQKIDTDGKDFNTDYHEAVALVPGMGDDKKGKVIDCVQTGYTLNDKVIRHAKVAVGQ